MGTARNAEKRKSVQDERARRLGELIAAPTLSLADMALYLDMPVSTLNRHRAQGKGPRTFKIGKKVMATQDAFRAWIEDMAKVSADH